MKSVYRPTTLCQRIPGTIHHCHQIQILWPPWANKWAQQSQAAVIRPPAEQENIIQVLEKVGWILCKSILNKSTLDCNSKIRLLVCNDFIANTLLIAILSLILFELGHFLFMTAELSILCGPTILVLWQLFPASETHLSFTDPTVARFDRCP